MTSQRVTGFGSLSATVSEGDTRSSLEALRDLIAETLDSCQVRHRSACDCECGPPPPRAADIAALSLRLADLLGRLDKLPAERRNAVDDLAARRKARRATTADSERPAVHEDLRT